MSDERTTTPVVLLVAHDQWTSRSMESVLGPEGYGILKASSGRQAVDLLRRVDPDAVIVDFRLGDLDGVDAIRELRAACTANAATPFFMMAASTLSREDRLRAFGAGVWDILRQPVDPFELVLRMETFVGAKRSVDRLEDAGLTDPGTGFYNIHGVLRRAGEVAADAVRAGRPLSCIVIGMRLPEEQEKRAAAGHGEEAGEMLAAALASRTRLSDAVGRLGPGEFVVVAPGTDRDGAARLADRVFEAVHAEGVRAPTEADLRAGFHSLSPGEKLASEELLRYATAAFRRAQEDSNGRRTFAYDA